MWDLDQELSTVLFDSLSEDDEACVSALAYELFGVKPQEPHERIHEECFQQDQPLYVIEDPLYQIYCWMCAVAPAKDATLWTSMTGAFSLLYKTEGGGSRHSLGNASSRRAQWLKVRFDQLWPVIPPNNGQPFLVVIKGSNYYVLEP